MAQGAPGNDHGTGGGSGVLLSAVAGAVIGAAGLAWWLLIEAERRSQQRRQRRGLELSRLQNGSQEALLTAGKPLADQALQDKVQQLNRAIEDVRRQLESLTP
ncbi:hypothetical protein [Cyanobium sp. Morenito 9A2]|uniref:hypothetical protein n=1 Tax=Cyanobium sp. Morenito 9A2 TaxID=2823718 RepID=UPI0020CF8D7F|nr:hypothetical protein [Cyanobium sp. Morenito 9A2]MCP9850554.1 hypothetical protein [Cyanobium sp. Morenito 9A2]